MDPTRLRGGDIGSDGDERTSKVRVLGRLDSLLLAANISAAGGFEERRDCELCEDCDRALKQACGMCEVV